MNNQVTKVCKACSQEKSSAEFHARGVRCRQCLSEARANKKRKREETETPCVNGSQIPPLEPPLKKQKVDKAVNIDTILPEEPNTRHTPLNADDSTQLRDFVRTVISLMDSEREELQGFKSLDEKSAYLYGKLGLK